MTKAEWSGWIQAIFSVVAILAASYMAGRQISHAERMRKQARWDERIASFGAVRQHIRRMRAQVKPVAELIDDLNKRGHHGDPGLAILDSCSQELVQLLGAQKWGAEISALHQMQKAVNAAQEEVAKLPNASPFAPVSPRTTCVLETFLASADEADKLLGDGLMKFMNDFAKE